MCNVLLHLLYDLAYNQWWEKPMTTSRAKTGFSIADPSSSGELESADIEYELPAPTIYIITFSTIFT